MAITGHVNNIPTMQFSSNTLSKLYTLSLPECVMCMGISKIMHCGILVNMPYCSHFHKKDESHQQCAHSHLHFAIQRWCYMRLKPQQTIRKQYGLVLPTM